MFTSLSWYIVRLVVLTLLILQITFNFTTALAQENSAEPIKPPETVETVAPPSATDNQEKLPQLPKTEEKSIVKTPKPQSKVTYPKPPHRYNMEAIEKFNEELYGN